MKIGERIRSARKALGLTQADLASRVDLGREAIITMEQDRRAVKVDELVRLARELQRPVNFFISGPEAAEPSRGEPVQGLADDGCTPGAPADRRARLVERARRMRVTPREWGEVEQAEMQQTLQAARQSQARVVEQAEGK